MQRLNRMIAPSESVSCRFVWSPTSIARFWDLVASEPGLQKQYFSREHAASLIRLARYAGFYTGPVLDYGCGPGYLAKALVEYGYDTTALEFSEISAKRVNKLIPPAANWHGCVASKSLPTPLPDASFEWIFSIEAYEHLLDEWIYDYFREIFRMLRPNGSLLLTTPYMEDLDEELIICPACEARFHRWGHLRSVRPSDLVDQAEDAGYQVAFCRSIDLRAVAAGVKWPSIKDISIRTLGGWAKAKYRRFCERKQGAQQWLDALPNGRHLVLIARRGI